MEFNTVALEEALAVLGKLLSDRKQSYEVVAIGGGGLLLLGAILRPTKDLDLVALIDKGELITPIPLPTPLSNAIHEIGLALNLGKDWMNIGPADLLKMGLPKGFKTRLQTRSYGGLTLHLAGRFDQICFKLFAAVDQGPTSKHFTDLKSLQPNEIELDEARLWCITQDVSEAFSLDLQEALTALKA